MLAEYNWLPIMTTTHGTASWIRYIKTYCKKNRFLKNSLPVSVFVIDEEQHTPYTIYKKAQNERSWETSAEVLEHGNETSQVAQNDNFQFPKMYAELLSRWMTLL